MIKPNTLESHQIVGIAFDRKRLISEVEQCICFCWIGIIALNQLNLVIDSYER